MIKCKPSFLHTLLLLDFYPFFPILAIHPNFLDYSFYHIINFPFSDSQTNTSVLAAANIESSPDWDTSCLAEPIYDLINKQFLCWKCPKPVKIQYLLGGATVMGSSVIY